MGAYVSWLEESRRDHRRGTVERLRQAVSWRLRRVLSLATQDDVYTVPWDGTMPFLETALRSRRNAASPRMPRRPRILHFIGTLGPGGAERQLCNFVIRAKRLGHDVRVVLMCRPEGEHGHYYHMLQREGIDVHVAGARFDDRFLKAVTAIPGGVEALARLPEECRAAVIDLLGELVSYEPHILHSWLDGPNLFAGIAGILAQIPLLVLSTRNVNPTHFPALSRPYYQQAYETLLQSPGVRLINNSNPGAEDYAAWLGIPRERVAVVLNGLDVSGLHRASPGEIAEFRANAGVPPDARILAGVFRLAEEKQPLVFLDVIRAVAARCPNVVAIIAGIGPLESELREHVRANGLNNHVTFVGRLANVAPLYTAADLTLLCSRMEGTPNVLLESQWLGCPVVSTRAGGATDAVADGVTGFLFDVGDTHGLQNAVVKLLTDRELRASMADQAPRFIANRFSVDRMVQETLRVYEL